MGWSTPRMAWGLCEKGVFSFVLRQVRAFAGSFQTTFLNSL